MLTRLREWWRTQLCDTLGHDPEETTVYLEGKTIIAVGCLRCDWTLELRDYSGLYPLPR